MQGFAFGSKEQKQEPSVSFDLLRLSAQSRGVAGAQDPMLICMVHFCCLPVVPRRENHGESGITTAN